LGNGQARAKPQAHQKAKRRKAPASKKKTTASYPYQVRSQNQKAKAVSREKKWQSPRAAGKNRKATGWGEESKSYQETVLLAQSVFKAI
jgi:hypothetical protein